MRANGRRKQTLETIDQGSAAPEARPSWFDHFFAQLDHQRVGVGARSWVIMVYGVHVLRNQAWVQLAPSDDPAESVVLNVPAPCSARRALTALEAWTRQPPENRPRLIAVMQIA
jgi:hypothetical protein